MKPLKHLNKYIFKYRTKFFLGIVFVIFSNLFAIYPAQVIREAFDAVAVDLSSSKGIKAIPYESHFFSNVVNYVFTGMALPEKLFLFGMMIFLFSLIKGFFTFLMRQTLIVMSRLVEYDLKNEVFDHYQRLSASFYKRHNTGDLMNRISEDVSRVRMYLGPAIMYTINIIILFILVITTMISINPKLTFYVLLPLPVLSITIYYVSNVINQKSEAVQRQLSTLSTFAQEAFSGIRVIQAYSRERSYAEKFEDECNYYKSKSLSLVKVNAIFHPFMILLIGLSTLLTIYIGGMEAIAGKVTVGNIAEFVIYVNMLTWPVASLGWVTSMIQRAAASQERINEFLHEKPEIYHKAGSSTAISGTIEFRNVCFTYPDSDIRALIDVSFKANPGETLAILGKTGSGKSTIGHLINRLYDVTEGEILIGGRNIKDIDLNELRQSIGYVPQDVFLFSDTIENNIAFSISDPSAAEIENAAKNAAIYDDIMEFPDGLNTILGERGITLSGGQKQRVSIARALINSPKILIFDDCLSAVDTETEEIILKNLNEAVSNKTSIIVSHRISTIKHCNKIIVMNEGKIVERGNHNTLLAFNGLYNTLYKSQLLEERAVY